LTKKWQIIELEDNFKISFSTNKKGSYRAFFKILEKNANTKLDLVSYRLTIRIFCHFDYS